MSHPIESFLPGARVVELPDTRKPFFITEDRQYDTLAEALENLRDGETIFCFPVNIEVVE